MPYLLVHVIALRVHNLRDAHLGDFHGASQTGAANLVLSFLQDWGPGGYGNMRGVRVTVEYCAFPYTLPARFQQRVLLGVEAETCRKPRASTVATITTRTYALSQHHSMKDPQEGGT